MKNHEVREPAVLITATERMQIDASGLSTNNSVIAMDCLSKRELQVVHKIMEGFESITQFKSCRVNLDVDPY